jgi:predicted metal-dependent phosphoesterase TrpH
MRIDLHLHTWVSDGDVSPTEVVKLAAAAGLDLIAITDHDTALGVPEAQIAAADLPLIVVPGIEISSRLDEQELHILGYWIEPTAESILEHQRRATLRRSTRMAAMVARLQDLGVGITYEDVEAAAGPTVKTLGRPHLARALHAGRHTRYYGEAFIRFIGDAGPAYVAEGFPAPADAIRAIHGAGGKAVWAHPPLATFTDILPALEAAGLDGVECFRPGVDAVDWVRLEKETRRLGLFPTGGSDWHGPARCSLGAFAINGSTMPEVLALAQITN